MLPKPVLAQRCCTSPISPPALRLPSPFPSHAACTWSRASSSALPRASACATLLCNSDPPCSSVLLTLCAAQTYVESSFVKRAAEAVADELVRRYVIILMAGLPQVCILCADAS